MTNSLNKWAKYDKIFLKKRREFMEKDDIRIIANKIMQAGGKLYLVGGAVRDELLEKQTHDEDYCVTGITAEQFKQLFPEAHIRGKAFEVFDIDGKEFAMARTEIKPRKLFVMLCWKLKIIRS